MTLGDELHPVAQDYLKAILAPDPARAEALVADALAEGLAYEDLCLQVIQPCMREIGRLWQAAEVSVAQEHVATAITQGILAWAHQPAAAPPRAKTMVAACPDGELHGLGLRIVADFAQRAGWRVLYLGTSLPLNHLISFVQDQQPEVVAVSTSLAISLPAAKDCFEALAQLPSRPFIVAGGNAYGGSGLGALAIGADAFAADAAEFKELLRAKAA